MTRWTELWSLEMGGTRIYCGIAQTDEGFAVDLFRGDFCVASQVHRTWADAERAARALARRYERARAAPGGPPGEAGDAQPDAR